MLPTYDQVLAQMADAERSDGWLAACERTGRFLVLNRQFVDGLAHHLSEIGDGPVVELCAGDGELADALRKRGVDVIATDVDPPAGAAVVRADAAEALGRHRPSVVLGSFVPFDAGVDELVSAKSHVDRYVVVNARLGGELASTCLWQGQTWHAVQITDVTRWMVCRHDVWMGPDRPILQHGEAWSLQKAAGDLHGG